MNANIQRWLDENFVPADDKYVQDLDLMRLGYMRALLWSEYVSTDKNDEDYEVALEERFNTYELPDEFTHRCRGEVWRFVEVMLPDETWRLDPDMAGIDLWLTRQGHGAGYGDGDWDKLAGRKVDKYMYELVKLLFPNETYVYVGDDGLLYFG